MRVWIVEFDGDIKCFKHKESAIEHAQSIVMRYFPSMLSKLESGEQLIEVHEDPSVWLQVLQADILD